MISEAELSRIKNLFSRQFNIDEKTGNMHLKDIFGITVFTMLYVKGNDKSQYEQEKPAHKVELSSFYMAQFPVTQKLYKAVSNAQPSDYKGDNRPVEQVTWYDAIAFCKNLNRVLSLANPFTGEKDDTKADLRAAGFRLPTETEWEFAARERNMGSRHLYSGSDDLDSVGWYEGNCGYETKPVGLKWPNVLGFYDMSGNVWEWCLDWYDADFYNKTQKKDPVNFTRGSYRVLRGGSFNYYSDNCRVSYRNDSQPGSIWYNSGFRPVLAF